MAYLSSAQSSFLFMAISLVLAGHLIWGFWFLERWRERRRAQQRAEVLKTFFRRDGR